MKIAITTITLVSIPFSFMFFYKTYDRIETLEMNERVQKLLLQDTKTISANWKMIALDATDLTTTQQKRLDIQEESLNKAMQLIRLQEDNIKRLTP